MMLVPPSHIGAELRSKPGGHLYKVGRHILPAVGVIVSQGGGESRHSQASVDGL